MEMIETPPPLPLSLHHINQVTSNSSTPYMSAVSSPQRPRPRPALNLFFLSAPTSPRTRADHSMFDDVFDDFPADHVALLHSNTSMEYSSSAAVPFQWELKPGVAKTSSDYNIEDYNEVNEKEEDFEFDFSGQLDMMVRPSLSSADELFDGGKIRPLKLKPPPSLQINNHDNSKIISSSDCISPRSPKFNMSKFKYALSMSPKHRRNVHDFELDQDPFEAAIRNSSKSHCHSRSDEREWKWESDCEVVIDGDDEVQNTERGRCRVKPTRVVNTNSSLNKRGNNSRKGISRSLSPLRVSEFALIQHQDQQNVNEPGNSTGLFRRGSSNACSRKWRLKDLFLFRSASEGHYKDTQSFSKRWGFRSSSMVSGSGSGSESGSVSKRRGQASTHEMIYAKNRAVAEELKKKTMLPYRHGLLACLGFSPVLPQFSYAFPNTPPS